MFVNLSHHDLDGVVSYIVLQHIFPNAAIPLYTTGYSRMDDTINNLCRRENPNDILFVTDLCIEDEKNIMKLVNKFKMVYIFDHHKNGDKHFHHQKIKGHFDSTKCGAKVLMDSCKKKIAPQIQQLVYYTDLYDLWKVDEVDFYHGYVLNTLFWTLGKDEFIDHFTQYGYDRTLPKRMKMIFDQQMAVKKKLFDETPFIFYPSEDEPIVLYANLEQKHTQIINDYSLFKANSNFYIFFLTHSNGFSFRMRNVPNADEIQNVIVNQIFPECGLTGGGHPSAFGAEYLPGHEYDPNHIIKIIDVFLEMFRS